MPEQPESPIDLQRETLRLVREALGKIDSLLDRTENLEREAKATNARMRSGEHITEALVEQINTANARLDGMNVRLDRIDRRLDQVGV